MEISTVGGYIIKAHDQATKPPQLQLINSDLGFSEKEAINGTAKLPWAPHRETFETPTQYRGQIIKLFHLTRKS